jgi:hypothetical protein
LSPAPDVPESYREGPFLVFTEAHHLRRGACCGSGCRHCPFEPRARRGNTAVQARFLPSSED